MSAKKYKVSRRAFLQAAGVGTGAVVFGSYLTPALQAQGLISKIVNGVPVKGIPAVALKFNGDVVIITQRSEMGQGTRSTLAAVLADEMEADWKRVTLRQADADAVGFAVPFPYKVPESLKLPFPYTIENGFAPPTKQQYLIVPEGSQFTDSSRSVTAFFQVMRLYGAGLRLALIRAAAKKWGVKEEECRAEKHRVYGPGGRSSDYRWLLLGAAKETPTYEEINKVLKKSGEFRYIGKGKEPMPFYDATDMVKGKLVYGADVEVPGMLTAMIERCPDANGALLYYDATPALAVPGVRAVLPMFPPGFRAGGVGRDFMPHAGVAVVATNTWAAWQGRRALRHTIQWDKKGPHATYDSEKYRKELEAATTSDSAKRVLVRNKGNVDAELAAGTPVEATYYVPHLAQSPMEPPVATALFKDGRMEVWAATQSPDYAQQVAGQVALGNLPSLPAGDENVEKARRAATVHMTMVGGGFGRKSKPDYIAEAALLARQMPGVPIRVQWTREDDVKFSYYNAVSSQHYEAALGPDGRPTALRQRSAFTSFFATLFPNFDTPDLSPAEYAGGAQLRTTLADGGTYPYGSAIERAQGLEDMPFDIPNIRIENCEARNHIRVGWMRSVANIYHAFGICSFADEMAHKAGRDSKDYLLELIGSGRILPLSSEGVVQYRNNELPLVTIEAPGQDGKLMPVAPGHQPDTRRLRAVAERAAQVSGWDEKVKQYKNMKGRGLGIAVHRSFLSYVAIVADVSLNDRNEVTVNDIYGVIDCGLAVNQDRVMAQMEGGIVYGLSYALLGEITVKDGAVVQNNFDDYQILRIHQTPKIHPYIQEPPEAVVKEYMKEYGGDVPPTGVGEPPTPAVAPAVANAIFAAGGPRIREIPFKKFITVL